MRTLSLVLAIMMLLAPANTCQQAQAVVPPDEVRITVWDNRHRGMVGSYKVHWKGYLLSVLLVGDSRSAHLTMNDPVDPRVEHFFDLDVESEVPPLAITALPSSWQEPIQVCADMAASALIKEAHTKVLPEEVKAVLRRIAECKFSVTGLPVQGEVSLSWKTEFIGEGPKTTIHYEGAISNVDIESNPKGVILTLTEHPTFQDSSPCTMELTFSQGKLKLKIIDRGQGGPPSEYRALEVLRREVGKVFGTVKLEGVEDDVLRVLKDLDDALYLAMGFDRFEVVAAELPMWNG